MKRKPMLFNKVTASCQGRGREVIGLIGTHHGTGVTYTGLMLAFYMGEELGRKTAFLECNDHRDMKLIKEAYEWSREDGRSFSYQLITCYKDISPEHISAVYGEDYECLILDFGTDFSQNKEEFLRCSTKIVVGGKSEWDIQKLIRFSGISQTLRGSDAWLYFIPQADEKTALRIRKETGRKVWPIPVSEEPTMPSRNVSRLFNKIFYT